VLVRLKNLKVALPDRGIILRNVSLSVDSGEVVLITGPSGSGKTTLLRVMASIIPKVIKGYVKGHIEPSPSKLISEGRVAYIPQEPWYSILTPYVWSELSSFTSLSYSNIDNALKRYNLFNLKNRTTFTLSAGEIQRLNFIIAEESEKDLILLDEPVSHLDRVNAERVIKGIYKLKNEGKAIVAVDHNINLWKGVVDKVYIISNGRIRDLGYRDPYEEVRELIKKLNPAKSVSNNLVCKVRIREFKYPASKSVILRDVGFDVHKGEIVLVKGVSGSGKTTLLKLIARRVRSRHVNIEVKGKIFYVPDNPLLFFSSPTPIEEVKGNFRVLKELGIDYVAKQPLLKLSSGERRRVALASAFTRGANLILLDEPTIGLDPYSKYVILKHIAELASRGASFIIASHDEDIKNISSEVVVLGEDRYLS